MKPENEAGQVLLAKINLELSGLISSRHDFKNIIKVWFSESISLYKKPRRTLAKNWQILKEFYLSVLALKLVV